MMRNKSFNARHELLGELAPNVKGVLGILWACVLHENIHYSFLLKYGDALHVLACFVNYAYSRMLEIII